MCIIAIKKANQPLPENKTMETMFKNNPDGAGFCYCYNEEVIIQKGYMSFKAFSEALKKVSEKIDTYATPMIFHFRIATHGGINPDLCHPFPVSNKIPVLRLLHASTSLAIVHNGVIPIKTRKGISDTMEYIATKINKRYRKQSDFYKNKNQRKAILAEIGSSKMAFFDCSGEVYTVGDFIEDNGIIYSNSSYKEREFSFRLWDDYVDYIKVTPLDDGYIIKSPDILECEYGRYFIDKFGKLYEYDYYFDVAVEIEGNAFNANGLPLSFDEENVLHIAVLR